MELELNTSNFTFECCLVDSGASVNWHLCLHDKHEMMTVKFYPWYLLHRSLVYILQQHFCTAFGLLRVLSMVTWAITPYWYNMLPPWVKKNVKYKLEVLFGDLCRILLLRRANYEIFTSLTHLPGLLVFRWCYSTCSEQPFLKFELRLLALVSVVYLYIVISCDLGILQNLCLLLVSWYWLMWYYLPVAFV